MTTQNTPSISSACIVTINTHDRPNAETILKTEMNHTGVHGTWYGTISENKNESKYIILISDGKIKSTDNITVDEKSAITLQKGHDNSESITHICMMPEIKTEKLYNIMIHLMKLTDETAVPEHKWENLLTMMAKCGNISVETLLERLSD